MSEPVVTRRSIWARLYHGETNADFVGPTKRWFTISGVVVLVGLASLFTRGLNLGIDFEGGVVWEVPAAGASVADARDSLEPLGLADARIQTLTADDEVRLRVQAEPLGTEREQDVTAALAELTGATPEDVSLTSVGPSWGQEISEKALRALAVFLVAITVYITFRFEWKMALATLTALVHDILVTVGMYSLAQFEVTPATVIALLTILGYSIYDGIVVFDRIDENTKLVSATGRVTFSDMVNLSLNQVLMRTLNTGITALLPIASLLVIGSFVLGATTLEEFALALLVGLAASAYSSIFIASPMLAFLKEREPRFSDLRRRIEQRGGPDGERAPAPAGEGDGERPRPERVAAGPAAPTRFSANHPPRPRKKTRRR